MEKIIEKLKSEWSIPKKAHHHGEQTIFRLKCEFNPGVNIMDSTISPELMNFYNITNGAILFKDVDYSQWGLLVYSSDELYYKNREIKKVRDEFNESEIIIGEFLGDSDLLLLNQHNNSIVICTPILGRDDWHFLELTFTAFLNKFCTEEGEKFWE